MIGYPEPALVRALARYAQVIACARLFEEEGLTFLAIDQYATADTIRRGIVSEYGPEISVVWA